MNIIGIPIGFYGYIFPGNINLMVVELYTTKKYKFLVVMLGLILIFETAYCILSLLLINVIKLNITIYNTIELISCVFIFFMGLWMICENKKEKLTSHNNTIYRGILSIIFHPQQIPFWLVIGVAINKFVPFSSDNTTLYQFAFFNSIGTLLAMFFYMFFGSKLFNYLKLNNSHLNKIMGLVYLILASIHFLRK